MVTAWWTTAVPMIKGHTSGDKLHSLWCELSSAQSASEGDHTEGQGLRWISKGVRPVGWEIPFCFPPGRGAGTWTSRSHSSPSAETGSCPNWTRCCHGSRPPGTRRRSRSAWGRRWTIRWAESSSWFTMLEYYCLKMSDIDNCVIISLIERLF